MSTEKSCKFSSSLYQCLYGTPNKLHIKGTIWSVLTNGYTLNYHHYPNQITGFFALLCNPPFLLLPPSTSITTGLPVIPVDTNTPPPKLGQSESFSRERTQWQEAAEAEYSNDSSQEGQFFHALLLQTSIDWFFLQPGCPSVLWAA